MAYTKHGKDKRQRIGRFSDPARHLVPPVVRLSGRQIASEWSHASIEDAIFDFKKAGGKIGSFNQAAEQLTARQRRTMVHGNWEQI